MTKTMRTIVDNYKALIDTHKNDFERGCYSDRAELNNVIKDEYSNVVKVVYGLMRYEVITREVADEILDECMHYIFQATK